MTPIQLSGETVSGAHWCARVAKGWAQAQVLLLLAGTDTAAVEGISAAGATAEARRATAAADAELLLRGPGGDRPHALPPLPAGVSPALIAHVACAGLQLSPLVVDLGAPIAPAVPHVQLLGTPARCLSTGAALEPPRVRQLLKLGRRWGRRPLDAPLVLAECVPGGTTTALAVLTALGVDATGLVSGSLRQPAHRLKAELVEKGLRAAGLAPSRAPHGSPSRADPEAVLAAVGDPMQALAAGLVLGTAERNQPILLAGGSQMAAVLALALALAPPEQRPAVASLAAVATTAWVVTEPGSDLGLLMQRIGQRWNVDPLAFAAGLRFDGCRSQALRDYEDGYVKEGVGAGGLALLWELSGRSPAALAEACDRACGQLLGGL